MSEDTNDTAETISPVTPEAIAEILAAENIECKTENGPNELTLVRTGFINMAITFVYVEGRLIAEALWRGNIPVEHGAQLAIDTNYYNQMQIAPRLRFFERDTGGLALSGIRVLPAASGLSRNQMEVFVFSSLEAFAAAFRTIEEEHPELVTWNEENTHIEH